jgi:RNA polymerase sigma factor (TIGR02999 family)
LSHVHCASSTAPGTESADPQQLFSALYEELHRLARRELRRMDWLTLGATTLLHEAYLNLQQRSAIVFPDRAHFLAYAGRAMRGLVIDYARSRQALKRGAAFEITSLPTDVPQESAQESALASELEQLSEAIERLAAVEPRLAQIVDLKYFSGFSFLDLAATWGISERTVRRDWERARLFLHRALREHT